MSVATRMPVATFHRLLPAAATALLLACQAPADSAPPEVPVDSAGLEALDSPSAAPSTPRADPTSTTAEDSVLTPDGWGPLRIGMTRAEVEAALGPDANPNAVGGPDPQQCDEFRPARAPERMLVMVEEGVLTRISLLEGSPLTTAAGFGPGAPASAVQAAYGERAEVTPHKYIAAPASYITVWASGPDTPEPRGLVYVTGTDGHVTHVHAGGRSIQYVEGCL